MAYLAYLARTFLLKNAHVLYVHCAFFKRAFSQPVLKSDRSEVWCLWCILRKLPFKKMLMYLMYTALFSKGSFRNLHSNPTVQRYGVFGESYVKFSYKKRLMYLMYTAPFLKGSFRNRHLKLTFQGYDEYLMQVLTR
ncbi:hypothetical protein Lmor_0255 [Legionella moravica]|uniref:Uncharacterized protein n=1 Tax=Legionella moravica TaxID=39962 RepID=A0A378JXI1_9GAMM|nr:hypothetical protein Lmor_0255 [Legionella moravica]STX61749.1 Uncharacterised protein [Legionella moravica]